MSNFPPLRSAVLQGLLFIKEGLDGDADFLAKSDYDPETQALLKRLLTGKVIEKIVEVEKEVAPEKRAVGRPSKDIELSSENKQLIVTQIEELIDALDAMGTGVGLATNERIQITKTKTNLIDQLLKMRERNTTAEKMEQFKSEVINLLADLGTEKDKQLFMARVGALR